VHIKTERSYIPNPRAASGFGGHYMTAIFKTDVFGQSLDHTN